MIDIAAIVLCTLVLTSTPDAVCVEPDEVDSASVSEATAEAVESDSPRTELMRTMLGILEDPTDSSEAKPADEPVRPSSNTSQIAVETIVFQAAPRRRDFVDGHLVSPSEPIELSAVQTASRSSWPVRAFKAAWNRVRKVNAVQASHPDRAIHDQPITEYERETGRNWAGVYTPVW